MRSFFADTYPANGNRGAFAPEPSDYVQARVLAANASTLIPVPAGAAYVSFSATDHLFARFGGANVTAAVPSASVSDGTAPELNPAARRIPQGATHIAVVAPAASTVTLAFYGA